MSVQGNVSKRKGLVSELTETVQEYLADVVAEKIGDDLTDTQEKANEAYTMAQAASEAAKNKADRTEITGLSEIVSNVSETATNAYNKAVNNTEAIEEINEKIADNELVKIDIVDSLDSTSPTKALSANQGRVLNEKIDSLVTVITDSVFNVNNAERGWYYTERSCDIGVTDGEGIFWVGMLNIVACSFFFIDFSFSASPFPLITIYIPYGVDDGKIGIMPESCKRYEIDTSSGKIVDVSDYVKIQNSLDEKADKEALERLQYYGDADIMPTDASAFYFEENNGYATATVIDDTLSDVVVPYKCTIDGTEYPVTHLAGGMAISFQTIILPNSITEIDAMAFDNCTNLSALDLPDSLTKINDNAFSNCSSLTDITIPLLTKITTGALDECDATIHCYPHSPAQTYAIQHDRKYKLIAMTDRYQYKKYNYTGPIDLRGGMTYYMDETTTDIYIETCMEPNAVSFTTANDCMICFKSGDVPPTISVSEVIQEFTPLKWIGKDVADGVFTPVANTIYTIIIYSDGWNVVCSVGGYAL